MCRLWGEMQAGCAGLGKAYQPKPAACLLIFAETSSFFPLRCCFSASCWKTTHGKDLLSASLAFAVSLAQDSSPGETSAPDHFCLRKVLLALRRVKAASCLAGWERNLMDRTAARARSCIRDDIQPTAGWLIHLGIFLSLHHPSSTGKLISSLEPIKNNILLIAG